MVTCKVDNGAVVPKLPNGRPRKQSTSTNSSGFRLLEGEQVDSRSSVSRNSMYKLKIDLMFDDTRSIRSSHSRHGQLDDLRGSQRTRSIIMYGRSELSGAASVAGSHRSLLRENGHHDIPAIAESVKKDVRRLSNSVQAQIERMFTDVAKDATCSFSVICLGSLPLKDKVTSLQGLQEPLKQLYLNESGKIKSGSLDICATGLRIKTTTNMDSDITPFHNIAVWSAVKFVVSDNDCEAAFLPLITDPDNIDKKTLFQPLSSSDQKKMPIEKHAPLFAVVMRSACAQKVLECHGFVCETPEDAIVIAATLYQSLMSHVNNSNSNKSAKRRAPRNQNGVSCVSIASSSAVTGSNYIQATQGSRRNSVARSSVPSRPTRKKRVVTTSLSTDSDNPILRNADLEETSTEERKRKSHKTKRAPPIPVMNSPHLTNSEDETVSRVDKKAQRNALQSTESIYRKRSSDGREGDILTRVAIPRSGSFLNTGGLTRYKSRGARRNSGKSGGGGGLPLFLLRSPLGFSELFNEFRLHENLHSLDEILSAIIDADGMSFNDLKPIYKEFLLKLAVTLTKDELFQRSKSIMKRQRKKKLKRRNNHQKKSKGFFFGTRGLKRMFQLTQFQSCRGKPAKPPSAKNRMSLTISAPIMQSTTNNQTNFEHQKRNTRVTTSGSDVSVTRNENTLSGLHRNSSSGYVSCSECSYDSEACTCTSADRCYCSLGAADHYCRHHNHNHHQKHNRRQKQQHQLQSQQQKAVSAVVAAAVAGQPQVKTNSKNNAIILNNTRLIEIPTNHRHSLISCKTEDKCYCSLAEENEVEEDTVSHTTYCDTDSCNSESKCYCKRSIRVDSLEQNKKTKTRSKKNKDNLGLDYELFSLPSSGSKKHINPNDALSVKKSVEAAAVFGDVRLSQTTDIKDFRMNSQSPKSSQGSGRSSRHKNRPQEPPPKPRGDAQSQSSERILAKNNIKNELQLMPSSPTSTQKSHSVDDILKKLNAIENLKNNDSSIASRYSKSFKDASYKSVNHFPQTYSAGGSSLEDTLGYLP